MSVLFFLKLVKGSCKRPEGGRGLDRALTEKDRGFFTKVPRNGQKQGHIQIFICICVYLYTYMYICIYPGPGFVGNIIRASKHGKFLESRTPKGPCRGSALLENDLGNDLETIRKERHSKNSLNVLIRYLRCIVRCVKCVVKGASQGLSWEA